MADKRFLGLGFTFAATDKGLEKKLESVHSHLRGISSSLQAINQSGPAASKSFTGMFKAQPRKAGSGTSQSQPKSSTIKGIPRTTLPGSRQPQAQSGSFDKTDAMSIKKALSETGALSKASQSFVTDIVKVLSGKGMVSSAIEDFLKVKIDVQRKDKRLTKESRINLLRQASTFAVASDDISATIKKIATAFSGVSEYLGDVKRSTADFLRTIGFDLDRLIPDELKAAGRLVGSIFKPILSIPKMIFGQAKKTMADKLQADANARLMQIANAQLLGNELLQRMSAQMGGSGSATENLFSAAQTTAVNTRPDGKKSGGGILGKLLGGLGSLGGMFSGLAAMATRLPIIGPLLSGLGAAASALMSPFKMIGGFLARSAPLFGNLARYLAMSGAEVLAWAAIIAVAGTAVAGFMTGLYNARDGVMNFAAGAWDLAKSFGGFIKAAVSGIPILEQLVSGFEMMAKFIIDIPGYIMKGLSGVFDVSKSLGESTGRFLGVIGDSLKKFSAVVDKKTESMNASDQRGVMAPSSSIREAAANSSDLRSLAVESGNAKSQELLQRQIAATERSNDILDQILQTSGTSDPSNTRVQIELNSRMLRAQQAQDANSQIGRSGGL